VSGGKDRCLQRFAARRGAVGLDFLRALLCRDGRGALLLPRRDGRGAFLLLLLALPFLSHAQTKALVGGTLTALWLGKNDPGFVHNGPLAGLVAVCAGSDLMHPLGALVVGGVAGALFVFMFTWTQNKWKVDDVLGVWPLHGLCGTWGGIAAGLFGSTSLGGLGGVSFTAQLLGTLLGIVWAVLCSVVLYGLLKFFVGLRLSQEEEFEGADLSIHKINSSPDRETSW
jgi:Amt family ammonium transporter